MSTVRIGTEEFKTAADGMITLDTNALDRVWPDLPDVLVDADGRLVAIRAEGYTFQNAGALRDRMHKVHVGEQWRSFQDILIPEPFDPATQGWPIVGLKRSYGEDRLTRQPLECHSGYLAHLARKDTNPAKPFDFFVAWFPSETDARASSCRALSGYANQLALML